MMRRLFFHLQAYFRWYLLGFLLLFSILIWSVVIHENRQGILTVVFLNVGQGNATFIESPTGTQVIVDGGPNRTLVREISEVLPWYDKNIDMLVVSHPDKDHYEGFIPLLDKYSAEVFMESGIKDVSEEYLSLKQKISAKKIPDILAKRGEVIDIGGGAYLEIIFPDRDVSDLETNNASIIARLVYGETSLLLEGDAPQAMENYVLTLESGGTAQRQPLSRLDSDIIEVGHHGAKTSTSEAYLKAVSPEFAVISVGQDNSYGHPHQETLETLAQQNIKVLRTDKMGRIVFQSDGQSFSLKN